MEGDFLAKYIKLKDELQQSKKKDDKAQTGKLLFEEIPKEIEKLSDYLIEKIRLRYHYFRGVYPAHEISENVLDKAFEINESIYEGFNSIMRRGHNIFMKLIVPWTVIFVLIILPLGEGYNIFVTGVIVISLIFFFIIRKIFSDPFYRIQRRKDWLNLQKNQLYYYVKSEKEQAKLISSTQEAINGADTGHGHHSAGEKKKVTEPLWNKTKRGAQIMRSFILAGLLDRKYKTIKWISNELKKFVKDNSIETGIKTGTLDNYFNRRNSDFFVTIDKKAKNVHKMLKQEKDKRSGPNDINEHLRRASTLTIESIVNGLEPLFNFGNLNHEDPEILAILIYLYSDTTKTSVEFLHGLTLGQLIKTLSNCRIIIDKINELD